MTEETEDRLRAALRAEAERFDADRDAWGDVQQRVKQERRRSLARRGTAMGVAAAAVVAVVSVGVLRDGGDDTVVEVAPATTQTTETETTETTETTSTTAPTPEQVEDTFVGIYPFASRQNVEAYRDDPGAGTFLDPVESALEFAREYLAMPDPVAPDGYRPAEGGSGSVDVHPRPESPMTTKVWLHSYDGVHVVYFAESVNIRPGEEAHGVTVDGNTVTVRGTSTAFEAQVDIEVRDAEGMVLGQTFVMGGGNGEMAPFEGTVTISPPGTPTGAVVLTTASAEDGSVQEATVIHVAFGAYSVFFHRDETLVEVHRTGPVVPGVLRQALEALVAGPTPQEAADGLSSLFSAETADILAGVSIDAEGTAMVDLARTVNNASTSAGSQAFLAELNGTVFQFPTVERVEYRLEGSCDAFWEWLQIGACRLIPAN